MGYWSISTPTPHKVLGKKSGKKPSFSEKLGFFLKKRLRKKPATDKCLPRAIRICAEKEKG